MLEETLVGELGCTFHVLSGGLGWVWGVGVDVGGEPAITLNPSSSLKCSLLICTIILANLIKTLFEDLKTHYSAFFWFYFYGGWGRRSWVWLRNYK